MRERPNQLAVKPPQRRHSPLGRLASRVALCATVLLAGCVYFSAHTLHGACVNDLESPVRNFCVVVPGVLWRGERPTAPDAQWLLEHRVGSVISLQLDDRRAFAAVALPTEVARAVIYFQVPGFNPLQMLIRSRIDDHVARFLAIVQEAPKPVYVHCRAGIDRTGVLAGAYRVMVEGVDPDQAIAEMSRFHSPWRHLVGSYIRSLSAIRQAQIRSKMAYWQSHAQPTGRFDCRRGQCAYVRNDAQATGQ